jgi:hypothetical protein
MGQLAFEILAAHTADRSDALRAGAKCPFDPAPTSTQRAIVNRPQRQGVM